MAYLLDTNTISEVLKRDPNQNVVDWFSKTHESEQYISVFSIGEIQKGIERLTAYRIKNELQSWFDLLITRYDGRILPFVLETTKVWARLIADLERRGRMIPVIDSFIAAIALEHDLTIVTHNARDFADTKAGVLNVFV